MRRFLAPSLLALTALATALTVIFPWEELEGSDAPPGYLRYVAHGANLQLGRWLIAVGGAGVVWALIYMWRRNVYLALAAVALAAGGVGISITAINDYGLDSIEPLIASSAWLATALLVLGLQWWAEGHTRPVVIEIIGDFEFRRFLTTGFVGLLWVLALASSVVGVLLAIVEYTHDESIWIGLLVGVLAAVGSIVWLLVVRLLLETVVVLFRIHDEMYYGNALALRSRTDDQASTTTAPDQSTAPSSETE